MKCTTYKRIDNSLLFVATALLVAIWTIAAVCSPASAQTVTTTSVDASPNPSVLAAVVTLTATVAPSVPDGETVTFYDGANAIGTGTTAGSVAALTTSTLAVGDHTITAGYAGDADFASSNSTSIIQTVTSPPQQPTITLTSSLNPSNVGDSVTFSATTSPIVPDGETVSFYDGRYFIGSATTSGGVAALTTTGLFAGNRSIIASYPGDSTYSSSASAALTQTVNQNAITITLASSLNPSNVGDSVTLTATTSPSVPDGEALSFYNGSSFIGSALTSGGVAALATTALPAGSLSIVASYPGDETYTASASSALAQTVNQLPTTTTIVSSLNPVSYGSNVTFTASVSPIVPDGEMVSFYNGSSFIGAATTTAGVAALTTSTLGAGSLSIVASYPGDSNYMASASSALTQTVSQLTTSTALISSLNPSSVGDPVTFTASVSPAVPDGETVSFYNGSSFIGSATTTAGVAALTTTSLPAGSLSIVASYPGDANYASSASSALAQTVNQLATSTSLASSLNPSTVGTSVTFTATVSPAVPDGETVSFYDGSGFIGSAPTTGGVAALVTSSVSVGSRSIVASYPGDSAYLASASSPLAQIVNKPATSTTIASSLNPSIQGQSVTFTATVSPSVPDGDTVSFYDGRHFIGSAGTAGSVAVLTTSSLDVGMHGIIASYDGDANYSSSASSALSQNVLWLTATTVASSLNPTIYGQSVTFTATVNMNVPDGETVTFSDGGGSIGTGTTSQSVATFTTTSLGVGDHGITATYAGDSVFGTSTSDALTQTVSKDGTEVTLVSSLNPANAGDSVTLTASIDLSIPDGETVSYYDNRHYIGSATTIGSVAALTISTLSAGTHTIVASYEGDINFASCDSNALTQVVNLIPSSITVISSENPATAGDSITFTATLSPSVPDGETVWFYNGSSAIGSGITSGGVATFTTSSLGAGGYFIVASYSGDSIYAGSSSTRLAQTVNPIATTVSIASSLNPSSVGDSVTFTATVSPTVPDGETVWFYNGSSSMGWGITSGGVATFTTADLAADSYNIIASYPGDSMYGASASSPLNQIVNAGGQGAVISAPLAWSAQAW